ncbi:MAG: class I SAM-dependent methyltransferase [Pseudolabrys sp.]
MSASVIVTADNAPSVLADLPRWPRLALSIVARLKRGSLRLDLPDGRKLVFQGAESGPSAEMTVRSYRFARRMMAGGDLGIAESYLRGEWDTPDLTQFFYLFCVNTDMMGNVLARNPVVRFWQWLRFRMQSNSRRQARRNIHAHYDLGNAFYSAWLDPTMTYSSALFEDGVNDLSAAQTRKYEALAKAIDLRPGHHVLEIGCGWGGFSEYAARHGARVTALTISREQFDYATRRIADAGLNDRVTIKLQDYRDETGVFDRIASIEMIEAVGEKYWPDYFAQLRDRLKPGGIAGIQGITIQDAFFDNYRREIDFIRGYIFPGGMLPTASTLRAMGEKFGLPMVGERIFGLDYARTLMEWRERFFAAWPAIKPLGFDERFRRLWHYYLAYCEAGFRSGNIDVRQMVFAKPA